MDPLKDRVDNRPLADRIRPDRLETFVGQDHLLAPGKPLRAAIESGNPHSFALNNALLSRLRIYVLKPLTETEICRIIERAEIDRELGLGSRGIHIDDDARQLLARASDGDARQALVLLEIAADLATSRNVDIDSVLLEVTSEGSRRFDKGGDIFYDQISALHKSVRGSNPDASLYWFARLLDGGCDPRYIARRVVRMASEDIGNADPRGLQMALDAWECYERLGSPEGELAIAQAIVYLACAPKSNAVYLAYESAKDDVRRGGSDEVPLHLRNAPSDLMRALGYGKSYRYAHDEPEAYASGERYFPERMGERLYYRPVKRGLEIKIGERLDYLRKLDNQK